MSSNITPEMGKFVLQKIQNGFLFESFAKEFLATTEGVDFKPVGGVKDNGIDGLEFTYSDDKTLNKKYFQFSIESNTKSKVKKTIEALNKAGFEVKRLIYITNNEVRDIAQLTDKFYDEYNIFVEFRDIQWFSINVNNTPAGTGVFTRFIDNHLHAYNKPETPYELINSKDSRIYIYLRQQIDKSDYSASLDEILVDTLIFLALEGTDPHKGIFRNQSEVTQLIKNLSEFDHKWLNDTLTKRLKALSSKTLGKIKHHRKIDGYCLPYKTRLELEQRQNDDIELHARFKESTLKILSIELKKVSTKVQNSVSLLEEVFHELFSQQGLEFSQFVSTGDGEHSVDKWLKDFVSIVIDRSSVVPKNRQNVKVALLNAVRRIIYNGEEHELEFLHRLSDTYRLLFLLQCDPALAKYFEIMAGQLKIYVDTSILIPAISEYFLHPSNRRYTNLLIAARDTGVTLVINRTILNELAAHLRITQRNFVEKYVNREDLYETEPALVFVPEILIRAYFYARLANQVDDFKEYIENFVTWNSNDVSSELVEWVKELGIQYEETNNLNITIDPQEEDELYQELKNFKSSDIQARTDAHQLLTIYAIREKNNELGKGGVFGYKTWWLTSDINSQQAFKKITNKKLRRHQASPYIRTDFLYNYISLTPSKKRVDAIYKKVFPTLLGVNISFHIPSDLSEIVQSNLLQHRKIVDTPRFKAQMRKFAEQLKSDPSQQNREHITSWFNERAKEISKKQEH